MGSFNIAVIGGSGLYDLDHIKILNRHSVKTPFGDPSAPIIEAEISDDDNQPGAGFYFLARHGEGHVLSPSEVNYQANIFALKKLGVKYLVSVSAVGSLKEELSPTMFVLPDQFLDWTKGLRARSFFTNGIVGHVSTAEPVELKLQEAIAKTCENVGVKYSKGGTYICIEGPQFSSKAESALYRSFGASIIGMTNVPEAYLAKEAGMAYATIAMVTDYDCWKDEHCSLEEILKFMGKNNESAEIVIKALIPYLKENIIDYIPGNQFAVITTEDKLSAIHREILDVLIG